MRSRKMTTMAYRFENRAQDKGKAFGQVNTLLFPKSAKFQGFSTSVWKFREGGNMTRLEMLETEDTARGKAEVLLTLFCEAKKNTDCPHDCALCTKEIEDYLSEEL